MSRRRSALLAALALTMGAASAPAAHDPAADADALARARAAQGRFCPAPGAGGAPGALSGFAAAALLGGLALARRRSR